MSKRTTIISAKDLVKRKNILDEAKAVLKKEFIGIDSIIDEIVHSIEAWFMYPEGQIRPTIINLWGLTGVGKTSLVSRLSELIGLDNKLFRFDIGDYSSGDLRLKHDFSDKLKSSSKQPIIVMFDEFQLGRTISEDGREIDRNGLRALWDLLDTGKISIINETYYSNKIVSLMLKLQHCVDSGVESSNGKITKNKDTHTGLFYNMSKKGKKNLLDEDGEVADTSLFVPKEYYYYIKNLFTGPNLETEHSIINRIMSMNHEQTLDYLSEILNRCLKPVTHDYSQSLIFVIGNLDEVYSMAGVIDPDYDADIFYQNSLHITITKVKEALQNRFRVEQIARLGNNHVLYPAFSSESYRNLISLELSKLKLRVSERYDIFIELDQSINDIIYREGVFPTQGTRPIFTTINNLIESYVPKIVTDIILNEIKTDTISWKFLEETSEYEIRIKNKNKFFTKKYPLKLKLDHLRKSTKDDFQAHTAVHESGHAVLSCMHLEIIPEEIVTKTASTKNGYCRIKYPEISTKSIIEKDIVVGLGGYVAEKLLFGENLLSTGSYKDIEMVTERAANYVKSYGMGGLPIKVGIPSDKLIETHHFLHDDADKHIEKLVKNSLKEAEKILKKNKVLLLKMSEYLSENSRISKELTMEYVKKYGVGSPNIREPEKYNTFKDILNNELRKNKTQKKKQFHKKTV